MHKNQVDLSKRRALLAGKAPARTTGAVSRNPLARVETTQAIAFDGTRRHGNKRSDKGGSATGGTYSLWRTQSQNYRDSVGTDPKWSDTISH